MLLLESRLQFTAVASYWARITVLQTAWKFVGLHFDRTISITLKLSRTE